MGVGLALACIKLQNIKFVDQPVTKSKFDKMKGGMQYSYENLTLAYYVKQINLCNEKPISLSLCTTIKMSTSNYPTEKSQCI